MTNDRRPFGMRTNDLLVAREKRRTSTNDNRCFFAISFGLMIKIIDLNLKYIHSVGYYRAGLKGGSRLREIYALPCLAVP